MKRSDLINQMRRRDFLALTGAVAALPQVAFAQQAAKVPRIAYLMARDAPTSRSQFEGLSLGLADFGFIEGSAVASFTERLSNAIDAKSERIAVDFLLTNSGAPDTPAIVATAVANKPDILMTYGTPFTQTLKDATNTIPILTYTDLLGSGFVASLGYPGGNITGVSTIAPDLSGKRIALLKESLPALKRVVILNIPANVAIVRDAAAASAAAAALGIEAVTVDFDQGPAADFTPQFDRVVAVKGQAVYVPVSNYFNIANKDLLCSLLIKSGLASVFSNAGMPPSATTPFCGTIGYGPNAVAEYRKFGAYIDAILKGAKPADLPVQQPTSFDFGVSVVTAKALGLTIPLSILSQATVVVE